MTTEALPSDFLRRLRSVTAKRPRTVIEHILKHGQITTEELQTTYGYNHPPRAIRDVREHGIPVETFRVTGSDGRSIAAYRFGDPATARVSLTGRTVLSTSLRNALLDRHGPRCNIYLQEFPAEELQVDHRIPYEIAGEPAGAHDPDQYMLLCASANRAKSWSCEHCENWRRKDPDVCRSCYWAYPDAYTHVAMKEVRRLDVLWLGEEVGQYERLRRAAAGEGQAMPEYVKKALRRVLPANDGEG